MLPKLHTDAASTTPLYRQIHAQLHAAIQDGRLAPGERLPATRELAGSIGLNRTTIASAYDLLEAEGLIRSHVGKGTFVTGPERRVHWAELLPETPAMLAAAPSTHEEAISFAASRPSQDQFPLEEFRITAREVIDSDDASQILQLGPASGYGPLRRYIFNEAVRSGTAREDDDVLVTSGVQQAFDLIQRVLASRGETVVIEDPVYPGLRNAFQRGGARVLGAPMSEQGVDFASLERLIEREKPRLVVLTPNFQNPTGTTIRESTRRDILDLARRAGTIVIENDLYGDLRYKGAALPSLKQLDDSGDTILLGSFSKVAFPGLRVGWVLGPRHFIARLTEAKEASDLHSDQLSQAVLLRFAESGRLEAHRNKMIQTGAERMEACLAGCARYLPDGSIYTRPEGGMNVWVRLPEPLDAVTLAARAQNANVSFLPGRVFAVSRPQQHSLRLSFVGVTPAMIAEGMKVLGSIFKAELQQARTARREDPSPALV